MKLGLQVSNFTLPDGALHLADGLAKIAQLAESAGFHSLWLMDHLFQIPYIGSVDMEMLEAYTTLGFLAAKTETLQLGTMVTGVTYRHPGMLAKIVTTLDVLSKGRAWLGIGAAWFEREHSALGIPYPPVKERFERLRETLEIVQQMWSDDNGPYRGEHYQLSETVCVPGPLTQPHPPILIGGMGETKTLRLVAEHAQACNFFEHAGLKTLEHKLSVLKDHCQQVGRDYQTIEKTVLGQTVLKDQRSANKLLDKLEQLAQLGFDQAIYSFKDPLDETTFQLFAEEVIPKARILS